MIRHIQSPGIVRTVYSGIFSKIFRDTRDIEVYIATLTGMQLGIKVQCPFPKIEKKPWFWKKYPDRVHLWVKFSIQNVILRVSRRKKCFPGGTFFLFLTKYLSTCPSSTKPSLHWTILVVCLHLDILFVKCSIINVWQCSVKQHCK